MSISHQIQIVELICISLVCLASGFLGDGYNFPNYISVNLHHTQGTIIFTKFLHIFPSLFSYWPECWGYNLFCMFLPPLPPHRRTTSFGSKLSLSSVYGSSLHEHLHQLTVTQVHYRLLAGFGDDLLIPLNFFKSITVSVFSYTFQWAELV